MKRLLLLSITTIALFSCSKSSDSPKYGDVIFYTLNPLADNVWSVTVDNVYKGQLHYTAIVPPCENNPGILGLRVTLTEGEHTVVTHKTISDGFASSPDKITKLILKQVSVNR